jgi:thiamine transport system substrate-binding protein
MLAVAAAVIAAGCSSEGDNDDGTPETLTILTHDSFALSDGTLAQFTEATGIAVEVLTGGDAGTMLNQAILTADNPIADVIFGIDNTFISRAVDNDILTPYTATEIGNVDAALRLDADLATPITYGDVCVNYDIAAMADAGTPPPTNLDQLTDPAYRDMLVVQDPATSSPGLAFLMATIAAHPEGTGYDWKAYWNDLFGNGVSVASDWSEAYYTQFSIAGGDRPMVVSYASSPPAEVFFGELDEAPTAVVVDGCFRQIEYVGILSGTAYPTAAGSLIDFLLSTTVQEDIPLNMFVYPTNQQAQLPDVFTRYTTFPDDPVIMDPAMIEKNRERWIKEWTDIARSR